MNIKRILKTILRTTFGIRQEETIMDGLNRHYYHLKKKLPHKYCSVDEFSRLLDDVGVRKGQTIILHSSWRALYSLKATPLDVINILIEKIGKDGTLLMPCYSASSDHFDVNNSASAAGVLSECFRTCDGVLRSDFPKFSMCGKGKYAHEILNNHQNSTYQFDEFSPYSIATKKYDAKVLLLGLRSTTHKISVFHCATYDARYDNAFYLTCFSHEKEYLRPDGKVKKYIDRIPECQNDKKAFRKLFSSVPKKTHIYNDVSIVFFEAKTAYEVAYNFCTNGGFLYKINKKRTN